MTLPGMPIAIGDPGFFVCKIDDGAPRTRGPAAPATRPPAPRTRVWLVLSLCPHCLPGMARYCSEHNAQNWWLTKWGR